MIKVNLGCGDHSAHDWINFDNSPNLLLSKIPFLRWGLWKFGILSDQHYKVKWPKGTRVRNLNKPMPFKSSTVNYVYTSHFLEHLSCQDSINLLEEIHRVLVEGGVTRIVIPDLQYYVQRYISENAVEELKNRAADNLLRSLNIITKSRDPHLWMYDFNSISARLSEAGFVKVEKCDYQKGRCPDVEILDYIPTESLWVEATK